MVSRGDILYSENFPGINHGKFFVVIGENADEVIGAFFINSNINDFLFSKPKMLALQVGLGPDDYPFLTHNSYLNCAQIIRIKKVDLINDIQSRVAQKRGKLLDVDIDTVLERVRSSALFSPSEKEFFI